jgi:hypothetical protein
MSRSTFLTTNELSPTNYHHGLMTTSTSINRNNPRIKRNLRDKRRSTGIRPNDVSLASTSTEVSMFIEFINEES